jgi:hypothetical protein
VEFLCGELIWGEEEGVLSRIRFTIKPRLHFPDKRKDKVLRRQSVKHDHAEQSM